MVAAAALVFFSFKVTLGIVKMRLVGLGGDVLQHLTNMYKKAYKK